MFAFVNNVSPFTTVNFNNVQGGFSTVLGDTPVESKVIQFGYIQAVGAGGTIVMNGSTFFQHSLLTNKSVLFQHYALLKYCLKLPKLIQRILTYFARGSITVYYNIPPV